MNKYSIIVLLVLFFTAITHIAFAQGAGNPGGGNTIPIDGGASFLAAAGVAYGVKKLYDHKKQKQDID